MAQITPAVGGGMVVKVNGNVVKAGTFRRERAAGELPIPTSGMSANADSQFEVPFATGLIRTRIVITAPYDTAAPFHSATYLLRPGKEVTAQFGMISTLLTPSITFKVLSTTDDNDVETLGKWEATLVPKTDDTPGYYTEAA
jgi:hypothetical protein